MLTNHEELNDGYLKIKNIQIDLKKIKELNEKGVRELGNLFVSINFKKSYIIESIADFNTFLIENKDSIKKILEDLGFKINDNNYVKELYNLFNLSNKETDNDIKDYFDLDFFYKSFDKEKSRYFLSLLINNIEKLEINGKIYDFFSLNMFISKNAKEIIKILEENNLLDNLEGYKYMNVVAGDYINGYELYEYIVENVLK